MKTLINQLNIPEIKGWVLVVAWFYLIISALTFSINSVAAESDIAFDQTPKQCIALHYGQTCYVDIEIKWSVKNAKDYCLYSSQSKTPLFCWSNSRQGQYQKEVVSNKNVTFYLALKDDKQLKKIAQSQLEMAWVYKKNARSRSSWRMF